jgi:Calcineurin-like phosphoesterase
MKTRVLLLASLATLAAAAPAGAATVWAVGDGAVPETRDDALAAQIQSMGIDRLLYLGDVYETGTAQEFATNYASSWGRFKPITHPTPGNHEWGNRAVGYDAYWGAQAVRPDGAHYYSFDLDGWHIVSLNSEEDTSAGSTQVAWLRSDLAGLTGTCTLAFWHRSRYTAGGHGDNPWVEPLWAELAGRASIVLSAHDHNYQRLAPERGITPFVVGTGGASISGVNAQDGRLAFFDNNFGALRLSLSEASAAFEFWTAGGSRVDSGTLACRPHAPAVGLPTPTPLRLTIRRPRADVAYRRGLRSFRGRATGAVGRLRLTLVRRSARGCAAFNGRRFSRSRCDSKRSFRAPAAARWRYRLPRPGLERGRYRLTVRARDAAGRRGSVTVRFRVSTRRG